MLVIPPQKSDRSLSDATPFTLSKTSDSTLFPQQTSTPRLQAHSLPTDHQCSFILFELAWAPPMHPYHLGQDSFGVGGAPNIYQGKVL